MGIRSWISWKGQLLVATPLAKILWPPSSATSIVLQEEKILAIDTGDYMMLPGGTCEYRETFKQTAIREVKEEAGIQVEIKHQIKETINEAGGNETIFLAEPLEEDIAGNWEGKARWVPVEDVGDKKWRFNRDVNSLVQDCVK